MQVKRLDRPRSTSYRRRALLLLTALVPLAVIIAVLAWTLQDGAGPTRTPDNGHGKDAAGAFFLSATAVLVCCFLAGNVAARLHQPRVMGEIAAGIVLGPSILGTVSPEAFSWLFPDGVLPLMEGLAQVGLVLFVFGVGREVSSLQLRNTTAQALTITQASLLVPLASGMAAGLVLIDGFKPPGIPSGAFVLFIGCALSITAFPVLARVISETGMTDSRAGQLSLIAAAIGDGGSWILLGMVLAMAHGSGFLGIGLTTVAVTAVVMVFLGPLRARLSRYTGTQGQTTTNTALAVLAIAVVAAAAATSALGVHQLIGAFLVGVVWPTRNPSATAAATLASRACMILLPFFFFGFGLAIDLTTLLSGRGFLGVMTGLLAVAILTKIGGAGLGARLSGVPWREAYTVGVLLNTRGLTEIIVLRIGYDAGIIGHDLLAVLTAVALFTTFMTGPLLKVAGHQRNEAQKPSSEDEPQELTEHPRSASKT
ncbi:cation:proton antiporter (plasmid) [Nocardiopsis flavescens]|uniref:LooU n=1 Tax=Nocardiopsis flavescens TaxID=758803 RepID=A0A6M5K9Z0_9ACTN|nr:LooU [Nocardiopsis flavescens]QKW32553.1 cation:proton antiporter [Nocardiopsis flavescens]